MFKTGYSNFNIFFKQINAITDFRIGKYINKEAFYYAETRQLRALASVVIFYNTWFFGAIWRGSSVALLTICLIPVFAYTIRYMQFLDYFLKTKDFSGVPSNTLMCIFAIKNHLLWFWVLG